jgi:hypothetical protein
MFRPLFIRSSSGRKPWPNRTYITIRIHKHNNKNTYLTKLKKSVQNTQKFTWTRLVAHGILRQLTSAVNNINFINYRQVTTFLTTVMPEKRLFKGAKMDSIKFIAGQALSIYQHKNVRTEILKCCADISFKLLAPQFYI